MQQQWRPIRAEELLNLREGLNDLSTSNLSVNLVIASMRADDISWTSKLQIPNLKVIRYVSDAEDAQYHPPVPRKGREALIYHTYFHDFYDDLPDLSIMIHALEDPWHIEGVLQQSMLFTLSRLDLERARQRSYVNLRADWENSCPERIDTTKSKDESEIREETYMHRAFTDNFGPAEVPRFFAGPCCSQFAVTKEAIQRHPRSQYKRNVDWLVNTEWSDYIAGRVWEHLFPWLFRGEAIDCPVEWKTYCSMYGICFQNSDASTQYNKLWKEKNALMESTEILREILDPQEGVRARRRIKEIDTMLRAEVLIAMDRGKDESLRSMAYDSIFEL